MLLGSVYNRRLRAIPDLSTLIKKEPAATLPFLIASNLSSFLFYSRYYNGNLLDADPLRITASLTEQLLNKDSQLNVSDEFQSAYFDHLKSLVHTGRHSAETISDFQPMILQDIKAIFSLKDQKYGKQLIIEAFLRYYDLLSHSELLCAQKKEQKKLRKAIIASKQKLIFYISYLKSKRVTSGATEAQDYWQAASLGAEGFIELFANDRMYQKISQS